MEAVLNNGTGNTQNPEVNSTLPVRNNYIPGKAYSVMNSVNADLAMWPMMTSVNGDESRDFVNAASRIMNNLRDRVNERDAIIANIQ